MSKPAFNNSTKREFAPSIGLYTAKSGNGYTIKVSEQVLEELSKAAVGGRLLITEVPEEKRTNDRVPNMRLTIFPPDDGFTPAAQKESNESL